MQRRRSAKISRHLFKIITRLRIEKRLERSKDARGQQIAFISADDFERLKEYLVSPYSPRDASDIIDSASSGVFYLIQLEPQHDPNRFKLGFATNIEERLRSHRTAAPFSKVIKTWPCRLLWEKTAIESISRGCERIHTEVFRGENIETILTRCEHFFALMPSLETND